MRSLLSLGGGHEHHMWKHPIRSLVLIWLVATVIAAQMGPFGTFSQLSDFERTVYWGTVIGMAVVIGGILREIVIEVVGPDLNPLTYDALISPPFVLIFTPLLYYVSESFSPTGMPFSVRETTVWVVSIILAMICVRETVRLYQREVKAAERENRRSKRAWLHVDESSDFATNRREMTPQFEAGRAMNDRPKPVHSPKPEAPLLARLPKELRGELLSFSSNNHYLDITTSMGSTSILLRFSDALSEVGPVAGLQVHRSHWVADDAVAGLRREGQKLFVQLVSGEELPVSRTYQADARVRWDRA